MQSGLEESRRAAQGLPCGITRGFFKGRVDILDDSLLVRDYHGVRSLLHGPYESIVTTAQPLELFLNANVLQLGH